MSELKTYKGESGVDLSIRGYNHIEGLVKFCADNGIAIDHEESAGVSARIVDDEVKAELRKNKPIMLRRRDPVEERLFVGNGQNVVDLALQEMGAIEGFVPFLRANGFTASSNPVAGAELKVMSADVVNGEVRDFYRATAYKVNTGDTSADGENQGIGWMIIEDTFIVG